MTISYSFVCTEDLVKQMCSLQFGGEKGPTKRESVLFSAVASKERVSSSIYAFMTLSFEFIPRHSWVSRHNRKRDCLVNYDRQTKREARKFALNDQRLKPC